MTEPKPKKKSTGRPCSICSHGDVKTINSLISGGRSFRRISSEFGMSDKAVDRHAENCLKVEIAAIIREKKVANAIDVHQEFSEQLAFAKKLRLAAEEYLSDPTDPLRLAIIPRADEIEVVYFDRKDTDKSGNPKKKKANLDILLCDAEDAEGRSIDVDKVVIKHVDLRKFALDAINVTDVCIDKFARLAGSYQQDKKNAQDAEIERLRAAITTRASSKGITYEAELENYLEHYASTIRPEIKTQLTSDLIQ